VGLDDNQEILKENIEGLFAIYGASFSANKILKVYVGPPDYYTLKKTNIVVALNNNFNSTTIFNLLYCMTKTIHSTMTKFICGESSFYLMKKPIDFSDILFIFAKNEVTYQKFLKVFIATFDNKVLTTKSKKKAELRDLIMNINSEIIVKLGLNNDEKAFIISKILLNLMLMPAYTDSIDKLSKNSMNNFYHNLLTIIAEKKKPYL